jgi:hypothetical protein
VVAIGTAFWEWMAGQQGLVHVWTVNGQTDIVAKLHSEPVDAVLFDYAVPQKNHPVWTDQRVQAIAWEHGGPGREPVGWRVQSANFRHADLGGVMDGVFCVRLATRLEIQRRVPQEAVGVNATLQQVLDPTLSGRSCLLDMGAESSWNTFAGLLSWEQRSHTVLAPMVYPNQPYVLRRLSEQELLAALDVPAARSKTLSPDTARRWCRELKLPLKVRVEVCEWISQYITSLHGEKRQADGMEVPGNGKRAKLSHPGQMGTRVDADMRNVDPLQIDAQGKQKAAKHDDAEVPIYLWNDRARTGSQLN